MQGEPISLGGAIVQNNIKNDVSFILNSEISLYEHQSTYNPNMPLLEFIYFACLYHAYAEQNKSNVYGNTLVKIPNPHYIVFYNGTKEMPDRMELKLSDAFLKTENDIRYEWTAVMLNINHGRNQKLMENCEILHNYAEFVQLTREYRKTTDVNDAISNAIDDTVKKIIHYTISL